MADKGMALALKAKRRNSKTSMAVGIDLVKSGEADAFVTAGNTGGAMATAYFRLDTIPGVERAGSDCHLSGERWVLYRAGYRRKPRL